MLITFRISLVISTIDFSFIFDQLIVKLIVSFDTAQSVVGEQLVLNHVTRNQSGVYLCIASNGVPPAISRRLILQVNCMLNFFIFFLLIVWNLTKLLVEQKNLILFFLFLVAPIVSVPKHIIQVEINQDLSIDCHIKAFPHPKRVWIRKSIELIKSNGKYNFVSCNI